MLESLHMLYLGLTELVSSYALVMCGFGGVLGVIIGALPGLGATAGCALLLPITYSMDPTVALVTLAAVYYGDMFGGGISAILINIPGDSHAAVTALDGYAMSRKGQAGKALFVGFLSSFVGGMLGAIVLTLMGSLLTNIGLAFGAPEMAAVILVAMTSIGWILGDAPYKGLIATGLGLLFATIGMEPLTSAPRYVFGQIALVQGIPFVPACIGLFGLSTVIQSLVDGIFKKKEYYNKKLTYKDSIPSKDEFKRMVPVHLRGAAEGFFIGMLPGSGATIATFFSYLIEKRVNKRGKEMGTGIVEGVAIAESADNAAAIGSFGPMFSLGIPGSSTSAILLGGLLMWGMQPGPLFMTNHADVAWTVIASMFVGCFLVALICMALIPFFSAITKVPNRLLLPIVISLSLIGAYAVNLSIYDLYIVLIAGVVGYIFLELDIPQSPFVLSLLLGYDMEKYFRQAVIMGGGDYSVFFTRGLSLGILIFGALFIIVPIIVNVVRKRKAAAKE